MVTETMLDCGLSLSPQEKGILKKFPFKCPECRCDSFYQKEEDFIVCAHCRHIWILTVINPSRRDCHQDAEEMRWQRNSN
jgi:hypothetical protein